MIASSDAGPHEVKGDDYMQLLSRICALLIAGAFSFGTLFAQDISRGSIAGVVRDPSGAVIQGATVTLSSPFGSRSTTTGAAGQYSFTGLIPGQGYVATIAQPGFVTQKSAPVDVRVNTQATVDFTLQVAAAGTQIEVSETATEGIDLASTTIGANINEQLYQNVPINRNVSSVIQMAPGVSEGGGTGNANPSISGASGLENQYFINGANVTDPGYGAFGSYNLTFGSLGSGLTFDFIREVQVQTGGFEAQYGQALGGVVNVLTKSGTNNYHGDAFFYFRPHRWQAAYANPNLFTVTQNTRVYGNESRDFGGDVGGYVVKDKLFWYVGFNPVMNRQYRVSPESFSNFGLGVVPVTNHYWNYSAKVDYNLNSNHQFEGSVFGDPAVAPMGFQRVTSLAANNNLRISELDFGSRTWNVLYNGVFSRNLVANANYSNYHNHFDENPGFAGYQIINNVPVQDGTGGQQITNGLGLVNDSASQSHQFTAMASYNASAFGTHTFQFGYQFENDDYNTDNFYTGSNFQIPDLAAFKDAAGKMQYGAILIREHQGGDVNNPIVLRVTRGNYSNPIVSTYTRYHSGFVQDSWVVNRHLTIKPGVRFEYQAMFGQASHYTFSPNWAPRVGVIFDPTGSRKTKVFANWGRFFEKIPLDIAVRSFSFESNVRGALYGDQPVGSIDLSPANYVSGGTLGFSGGPDALTQVAGGTKAQYQDEVVAGVESQLSKGTTVGVRGVYRHLRRILEDVSGINVTQFLAGVAQQYVVANPSASLDIFQNAYTCAPTAAGCDPSTGFTDITNPLGNDGAVDGFPNPSRIYKAIEFTFAKRFSANWQFMGNYRLSKLYGNYEGLFRNDNGQSDPNITSSFDFTNTDNALADQFRPGLLPTDRTHEIKLFTNYAFGGGTGRFVHHLNGLNIGVSWLMQSGSPISNFLAHPAYDNAGEIPIGGRGSLGRTDWIWPVDVHADYTIKLRENLALKFVGDMFNVFNQKHVIYVDQWSQLDGGTPNPDFLQPGANLFANPFQIPRYTRVAVRLEF